MASSIEDYTMNPWNKTNSWENFHPNALSWVNNLGSKTNYQRKSTNTSNADTASWASAGDKRNTTTPIGGVKPSPIQCQKKQRRAVTNNTVKVPHLDMGMFWLYNPKIRMGKIPRDLPEKVCIQFYCRGRECKKESETSSPFLHSNLRLLNSLATISWQRKLDGSMSITSWSSLASSQSTKLSWAVRTDPPVRRLDLFLILLFSTWHPNQSVSCFNCITYLLIIRSGPLFTSKACPTNSDVEQFCGRH